MKWNEEDYFNTLSDKEKVEYLFLKIQKQKETNKWFNIRIIGAYVVIFILFVILFGAFTDLMTEVVKWHPIPFDTVQEEFHYEIYK